MTYSASLVAPPRDLTELAQRAAALEGLDLDALHARDVPLRGVASTTRAPHGVEADGSMLRRKGKVGQLVERALGASAGSRAEPDFIALGVELKTVPVTTDGRPRESTFVCSLRLGEADRLTWQGSKVRAKLAHVLFVPIVGAGARRSIGRPCFWRPTPAQEAALAADFDYLMAFIARGEVDALTAHHGRWLQVRPKAAHGGVRTLAYGPDEEPLTTIPRGFYLRARCVGALLRGMAG